MSRPGAERGSLPALVAAPGLLLLGCLAASAIQVGRLARVALQGQELTGAQAAATAAWVFWLCLGGGGAFLLGSWLLGLRRPRPGLERVPGHLRLGLRSRAAMLFLASAAAGVAAVVWIDGRQATALAPGAGSMLGGDGALVSLLALVFALGVGILSGRSLRAEALGLVQRLDELARDGHEPRIGRLPVHSPHETGKLAAAFNRLAARLEEELGRLACYAEKVEQAERLRAHFLRNVSHELRTPLNSILGYSDLLLRGPGLGERAREALTIIRDEGERLLLLINDILWTSQLEAGRVLLHPVPVRLDSLVAAVQELGPAFRRRPLSLRAPAGLEEIVADVPRLVRSLAAMLEVGGEVIEVEALGPARVQLRVRLGAPPPAPEQVADLFTDFGRQASAAPGIHMGLGLARRVAQLHGGGLELRASGGEGELVLELPLGGPTPEAGA
ncbi:MAG TPA: HAMP domain-containing sensor histidine kinase [Myxococcota bacterium]|nr:HAMP domain-containing sensor histidine kinase [Myxococcota bacterium]HRY96731.1 HAMP domain-containing sensor histidine kinase [Myxococcota bacterium]HSA22405.1 HAMP domain-containing sensor histidine kinase [Myxococcota bacterium]